MLRKALPLLGLGLVAGCAPMLSAGLASYPAYAQGARLLDASHGQIRFALNEPAYVAIFEVVPGVGASLRYPASSGDSRRLHRPGMHTVRMSPFAPGGLGYSASAIRGGPVHLFMIASDSPLRVAPFVGSSAALRSALGFATLTAASGHAMFSALESLVVPYPETASWTTDVYTIWPTMTSFASSHRVVTCADGRRIVVTGGLIPAGCFRSPDVVRRPPPSDSAKSRVKDKPRGERERQGWISNGRRPGRGSPPPRPGVVQEGGSDRSDSKGRIGRIRGR